MRFTRRRRTVALATALLLTATACGDDGGSDTSAESEDVTADEAEEPEGDEEDDDSDGDGGDGEGSASATWEGEDLEFSRVTCEEIVDSYAYTASIAGDNSNLQLRFTGLDGEYDFSTPDRVELFFDRGETIGDGENYVARGEDVTSVASDDSQASGEIHLEPDDATQAPEVNPEGGTLEFEISCP